MNMLEIGDRVSFDTDKHFPLGSNDMVGVFYGTVLSKTHGAGVQFDEWISGHNLFDDRDVNCAFGHGWYLNEDLLDKVEGESDTGVNVEIDPDILFY